MLNKLLYRYTAGLPCRLIKLSGRPYLERYYVGELFGVTFYLHRFVSSDSEMHLHNHPWGRSCALVLTGGYIEERVVDMCPAARHGCITERKEVRWFNWIPGNFFHRIHAAHPGTWTLFAHGQRAVVPGTVIHKGWGFIERHDQFITLFKSAPSSPMGWERKAPLGKDSKRENYRP